VDEGEGYNLNLPLAPSGDDTAFLAAVDTALGRIRDFGAEALVLSLGYDAHADDPLSVLKVTTAGFRSIGERVRDFGLPVLVVQEGGYQVSVIGDCLGAFLDGLAGDG
jgi:acetoin utilization deacetylase AcuC-like enzyme